MDDKYLSVLEYDKIIEQLAGHTSFSAGRELALALRPSADEGEVRRRIRETTEAKDLLSRHVDLTVGGARDVRPLARRAHLGATLRPDELIVVRITLLSARSLHYLLLRMAEDYPLLAEIVGAIQPLSEIIDEVGRCLDGEGRVLDEASPTLARLRRESAVARERLMERLQRIVTSSDTGRFLQEPIVTERGGRYVIPLKTEFKGRIPGIIHDQSSSGATLFIEPLATVELNNRWQELQLAEQREVERILAELSGMVGDEMDAIVVNVEALAELDLALAKGRYSFALRAVPAEIGSARWPVTEPREETTLPPTEYPLHLVRARHPLLPADTVVPIDVYLGGDYTVLVVTGPNTGGKTVTLKTVGLLAAMSQAGMHIPVSDGSQLPVFNGIYADIGDEQSIEQSLSTFSSHMTHIVDILERAGSGSLVLLDEVGAGTDPVEGAALAQALITTLLEKGCLTVCSSHYSQLKIYAFSTPGVQNASVEFDVETLSPTYRLIIGLPGRSNAFAIAQKLGLDRAIIERAQDLVAPEELETDMLLARVRSAGDAAERAHREAEENRRRVREMEHELRRKLALIEEARRQVLNEAREEGRRELERLRAEVRQLRAGLSRQAAEVPATQAAREALARIERLEAETSPIEPHVEPELVPASATQPELRVGDTVYITTLGQTGELIHLGDDEAEVRVGGFRLRTQRRNIAFRSRAKPSPEEDEPVVRAPRVASPGMELHLRGKRAEEVVPEIDRYLNDAYLSGLPYVHIVHGKGMGVLKQVVRDYVAQHPLVASYRPGELTEGGDGVTVLKLRSMG
ncbi:MAG TPA: endonuclease MutS2 [Chloroflexi bacterium]|nr:endonuclease MutS2 [Chloroflexota bacterium]